MKLHPVLHLQPGGGHPEGVSRSCWMISATSSGAGLHRHPGLVERLRAGLPIDEDDQDTWYQGGNGDYLDYPPYQHIA
jgi:hypothetical protein